MNPLSIQMDEEARRMARVLAEKWGLPKERFISRVLLRCLERIFQQESSMKEIIVDKNGTVEILDNKECEQNDTRVCN